jgi:hypothetical protein
MQWVVHDYRDEDVYYNPSLKSPVTMAVDIVQSQFTLQLSSMTMENTLCITVKNSDRTSLTCLQGTGGLYCMSLSRLTQPWISEQNQV